MKTVTVLQLRRQLPKLIRSLQKSSEVIRLTYRGKPIAHGSRAFTTDYVLDETLTLFKARGVEHASQRLFEVVDASQALALHYIGEERFRKSRAYFERHADHSYSFTDCASFVMMREFGAVEALTKDEHFREAGFQALLLET